MSTKRNALGKGLSALLENANTDITNTRLEGDAKVVGSVSTIEISKIETNPFQPRTQFDEDALNELAGSIKEHGIIQPITVRKLGYDKYQLISGERRFRASQIAGLTAVPAYIRIANDQAMLEMALVENIQRENLDAIEVAISYKRLIDECNLTQEQLSQKVSKQRSTITNYLRLLKLPVEIQLGIREGDITMGHARALINIEDPDKQLAIYQQIVLNDLSVRDVEDIARGVKTETSGAPAKHKTDKKETAKTALTFEQKQVLDDLRAVFNAKVQISKDEKGKGKIVIPFKSDNDLKRILDLLDA
ncbi:MAG: ParB/RepB/Spo0J family partition protein [Bacteroidetes bacterium]|nr:ParB/RepB/Spo0J family partition protein [Bacteroidia bacterium]MBN8696799.1 ParB/RepB/Spo0J family partition protein [Bacteroidota bacterium]